MAVRLEPASDASGDRKEGPAERAGDLRGDRRQVTIKRLWPPTLCCGLYLVLAMVMYGHFGSLGSGHIAGSGSLDSIVQIWWLAWTAHALPQGHNLLLGQAQNYPLGQNFGVNASTLVLGILFMPITKLFGVAVTWNIALRLAIAVSAASMCLVLRRWTSWWPAAFLGGLLYGFCAYNSHLGAYLFLIFVPLPPIIFLLLDEIVRRQRWRAGRTGVLLGVVCAVQYFISSEVLANTVVMGSIAVVLFLFFRRRSLLFMKRRALLDRWRYALTALACSLGVGCLLLSYPLWFTFSGPEHLNGPPETAAHWAALLPVDLLSIVVPDWLQRLQLSHLAPAVRPLANGALLYLGLPLIVVLALFAVFFRRKKWILFAGALAVISFVLSLGPRLRIDGHLTEITLPFALFEHLPALNGFQTGRFALLTDMFAAAMFAIGINELWKRLKRSRRLARLSPGWRTMGRAVVLGAVVVVAILPLVPSRTQPSSPTNVPTFFTSAAVDSIPPGSVVLAYPYPDQATDNYSNSLAELGGPSLHSAMLDDAVTGMRYKLLGGYGWLPSPTGKDGTNSPDFLKPHSVQTMFDVALTGTETSAQREILSRSNLTSDLGEFLRQYDVQTVIVGALPSDILVPGM